VLKIYILSGNMVIGRFYLEKETQKKENKAPKKRSRSKTATGRQFSGNTTPSLSSTSSSPILTSNEQTTAKESQNIHWDPDFSVNKAFELAKENVVKAAASARSENPYYTETIQRYQEQNIQSSQKIADNYIKIHKEIISLFMSWWNPYWQYPYQQWTNPLISPQGVITAYTNIVSNFVSNTLRITCLVNEATLINMEHFKSTIEQTKERYNDLASACVNMIKILESKSPDSIS
jgi:hypothetical protein